MVRFSIGRFFANSLAIAALLLALQSVATAETVDVRVAELGATQEQIGLTNVTSILQAKVVSRAR